MGRRTLDVLRSRLTLEPTAAQAIEDEVLKPYRQEFHNKLQQYEQVFTDVLQRDQTITEGDRADLQNLQQILGLRNEDTVPIEAAVTAHFKAHQKNLQTYEQTFDQTLRQEFPLNDASRTRLAQLKQQLELTDAEVSPIEMRITAEVESYHQNLQQYEQLLVAAIQRSYPLPLDDENRNELQQQQESLGLSKVDVAPIEAKITAEIKTYQQKLQQYEQAYVNATQRKYYLSESDRKQLEQTWQTLGLREEDVRAIESQITTEIEIHQTNLQRYEQKFVEATQKHYPFNENERHLLNRQQRAWDLSDEEVIAIGHHITSKIEEHLQKLQQYEQVFKESVQFEYPLSMVTREELQRFQQVLELSDATVTQIEEQILASGETVPNSAPEAPAANQLDQVESVETELEERLPDSLNPQADECIVFPCQPPSVAQAHSRAYGFQIEASSRSIPVGQVEGILEILPIGFIKFGVTPLQQSVPLKAWLPDWKTQATTFWAELENLSNVAQQVNVDVQGLGAGQQWTYLPPVDAELGLGSTVKLPLEIQTQRPWIGLPKSFPLQMTARLNGESSASGNGSVDVDPDRQPVKLLIRPIIPVWLVLALLALLIALFSFLFRPNPIGHTDFVNAVRFNDDLSLVSGADDCTIRRWRVNGDRLDPKGSLTAHSAQNTCKPFQSKGVLAFTNKPVRALAFSPRMNDRVAAGLNNGVIQIWHLLTQKQLQELPDDGTGDRVFDLMVTPDAQQLLSGHGSGKIRVWQRQGEAFLTESVPILELSPERNYSVYALAISPDGRYLVSAGSKNTLAVWDMRSMERPATLLMAKKGLDSIIWDVDFKPESHTFATADSDGNLKLWDLDQCGTNTSSVKDSGADPKTSVKTETILNCEPGDRWQASKAPIRAVRFSRDGTVD